jgi:hypothetical protein
MSTMRMSGFATAALLGLSLAAHEVAAADGQISRAQGSEGVMNLTEPPADGRQTTSPNAAGTAEIDISGSMGWDVQSMTAIDISGSMDWDVQSLTAFIAAIDISGSMDWDTLRGCNPGTEETFGFETRGYSCGFAPLAGCICVSITW